MSIISTALILLMSVRERLTSIVLVTVNVIVSAVRTDNNINALRHRRYSTIYYCYTSDRNVRLWLVQSAARGV